MKKSIFPFITIMLTVVAFFTIRRASAQKKRIAQRNLEDAEQIVTPVSTKATPSVDTVVTPVSTKTPTAMSTPVTSNWNEQKSKLKAKFATLTDADLYFDEGKKEAMLTKVQTKLGKTKEEFQKIIANL